MPVKMDFKLSNFVEKPTLDLFNHCTKEQLVEIADHFQVDVSKQLRKPEFKSELWSALTAIEILPPKPVSPSKDNAFEMLHLTELDLEMCRLDLRVRARVSLTMIWRCVKWKKKPSDKLE